MVQLESHEYVLPKNEVIYHRSCVKYLPLPWQPIEIEENLNPEAVSHTFVCISGVLCHRATNRISKRRF